MKILILAVGRLKEDYLRDAENEYRKRLRPYCNLELVEFKDERALAKAIPTDCHLYLLDERGRQPTSPQFAREILGEHEQHGRGLPVVFAIGGPDGHSDELRKKAKLVAFGRLTIAHRLMRVILLEQVYRAYRILRNEPYHRE